MWKQLSGICLYDNESPKVNLYPLKNLNEKGRFNLMCKKKTLNQKWYTELNSKMPAIRDTFSCLEFFLDSIAFSCKAETGLIVSSCFLIAFFLQQIFHLFHPNQFIKITFKWSNTSLVWFHSIYQTHFLLEARHNLNLGKRE